MIKEYEDNPLKGPTSLAYNKEENILYITDAGNFLNSSLYPCNGSLYAIDLDTKIMKPLLYNCLSFPADVYYDSVKSVIYVAEAFANRIVRLAQHPVGVYNSSVFYQFSGRMGPTALAMDELGNLYVARYEYQIVCFNNNI